MLHGTITMPSVRYDPLAGPRANAYILLRSDGFPTLHIGKRMVVPKDRFLQWITDSVNG